MSIDTNKTSGSSYTAGLGDLGSQDGTVAFSAQTFGASTTITQTFVFTLPKTQALAFMRIKWGGITYNNLQNFWSKIPCSITFIDSATHPTVLQASYVRANGQITVTVGVRSGSGTGTIPNMTVSLHARFYELPF